MHSEYGNVNCSNTIVSLVGLNLTRFTWEEPIVNVDFYEIILLKSDTIMRNENVTAPKTNLDVLNLDYNQK